MIFEMKKDIYNFIVIAAGAEPRMGHLHSAASNRSAAVFMCM